MNIFLHQLKLATCNPPHVVAQVTASRKVGLLNACCENMTGGSFNIQIFFRNGRVLLGCGDTFLTFTKKVEGHLIGAG